MAIDRQAPESALRCGLKNALVNTGAATAATIIGNAFGNGRINWIEHKAAHIFVGGAAGAILSDDPLLGAASGATGAVVAEMLMEAITPTYNDFSEQTRLNRPNLSDYEMRGEYENHLRSLAAVAKLAAASTGLAFGNVNTAFNTADNAVENNFIPMMILAAGAAWSAYEMYQAYQEEGLEGAAKEGAKAVALTVAGGAAVKGASVIGARAITKVSPYAQPYIKAFLAQNPEVVRLIKSGAIRFENVVTHVKGAPVVRTFIRFDNAVDAKVRAMVGRMGNALSQRLRSKALEAPAAAPSNRWGFNSQLFNNKIEWTAPQRGTGQTYTIYQRSDIDWNMVRTKGDFRFIGKTNAQAVKVGVPPQLPDGNFVSLHHLGQDARGGLIEINTKHHKFGAPGHKILHSQHGKRAKHPEHPVDHKKFRIDASEYWKLRETGK